MATLIGQELGGYRIISQVGKGGMATVYKAFQPSLDRYVAVKVMPPFYAQEDETFIKRFKREAQSIAKLRHPNILLVIDFGEHDGLIYIVMEFVDAGTLRERLGKPLPFDQTVKILDQVASALDYAHMQGLVHRDVKPSNILLPKPDWPLLTDFGLAKIVGGSQLTITGTIAGTPAYMSPEQGQGESVDSRSDIYSLGIVLYEMMTGCVPYEAETPMAVVVKHIIEPLPLPTTRNPDLPEAIERVILKALAKNPDDRYQRATELGAAFRNAVGMPLFPSEKTTVTDGLERDLAAVTRVEDSSPIAMPVQEEGISIAPPPDETPLEMTEVEVPSEPLVTPPLIREPYPHVVERPKKKPITGLLEDRPWLKWFIPAGGVASALCILGLALAFIIIPNIKNGSKSQTEVPPTLTAEEHVAEGQAFYEAGEYNEAILAYEMAINQGVENLDVYFLLADVLVEQDRLDEALGLIDRVIRLAPEDVGVRESAGWFYHDLGYHYQAIEQFERALALNPDATHFLPGLAESYRGVGEYAKADEVLGITRTPGEGQDPYELEAQGWDRFDEGDFKAAEELFRAAVDIDPGIIGAWEGLAETYWYQYDYESAIGTLDEAINYHPENGSLHEKLGWVYWDMWDLEGAETAFNKAIYLDPSLDYAWEGLSSVYYELGDLDQAISVIQTALTSNPENGFLYEKLGWLYWEDNQLDPAIQAFENAINIEPETTYAYYYLSEIWLELGDDGQALSILEQGIAANPNRADLHQSMGYLFLEWAEYEEAIDSLNQATRLDSEDGWNYLYLGFAYRMVNRWDESSEAYEQAEVYSFDDPWLSESLGWEYVDMGNCERALRLFEQALAMDPTNEGAREGMASCSG